MTTQTGMTQGKITTPSNIVRYQKEFRVVSVSSNTNSFGLHGVILLSKDGEAYQLGASYLYLPWKGDTIVATVQHNTDNDKRDVNFTHLKSKDTGKTESFSYEIPERLSDAPTAVINEVFKN